ncbi:3-hydroxybutyrate dehydrogenase [Salinarimonas ramus]|uniref:3-hydroxybutyrate dehydrogenase n=1 Tax=Salinarimonas ramus TaxID=690164 RepID=A0A917QAP0_9HYPH|nr:3-hydroxybutyrate dehydrogenase [Salinarimonas ramus]GGK39456.1 3-hydroxybutyrate dehydrogenase [Salinarimonas ramus]
MKELTDRTALVTGGTSGIGLAIAKALAAAGANVMIDGFGEASECEALARSLADEHGIKAAWTGADVSKPDQLANAVDRAETELGPVDILVNNAGVQHVAPVEDFPVEQWDRIIAINLSSAFYATRLVVAGMKERGWGRVINTASAHSLVASPYKSAYVAAKHGLVGFTKTVALETAAHGVTVNCISPGYVWTPLVEKQIPDTMKARGLSREQVIEDVLLKAQPTKAFVTVEQVAAMALFLCSDAASQVTGANISMDGGWTAQ